MGATVTTGKKVGAFLTEQGRIGYVLFEETFERNCHPHTPSWSCVCIGFLEDVMQRIFMSASSCEGGGLQGRGGRLTPEGYIQGWMAELANPAEMEGMEDVARTLRFEEGWRSALPAGKKDFVRSVLTQLDMAQMFDALEGEGVQVTLKKDFALLAALYNGKEIGAWRLLDGGPMHYCGYSNPGLGHQPKKVKAPSLAIPSFLRVGRDELLKGGDDGRHHPDGWDYSVIGRFIANYAERELEYPGSYRSAIKAYREACTSAPHVPDSTIVQVSFNDAAESYEQSRLKVFAEKLGKDPDFFEVSFSEIKAASNEDFDAVYHATLLGSMATWVLPTPSAPPVTHESLSLF